MPLPTSPLPEVDFPTLGWQIADWIETFLCHGPGDVEGDAFEVDDEIAAFIAWCYRVHSEGEDEEGRRQVQRAILSRPKGRAKSEIAGAIVCAEALGPVRFSHWAAEGEVSDWGYEFAEGEPVGKPVRSPYIRCLATEEDQSGNTYDNVVSMLTQGLAGEHFGLKMGKEVGITRVFLPDGGEITPSTSSSAAKDGGKETFAVADETHLYTTDQLRKMYRTVARNTGKRKEGEPWMLDTTTAWQPGERSIAELASDKYQGTPVAEAVLKTGVLYDHRQAPEPKRFNVDASLIKAMKDGYGPAAEWMDFKRIVRIIRDAEDPEAEAYRYWLNRPRLAGTQWVSAKQLEDIVASREVAPGSSITLGIDASEYDDHTALIGCTEDGYLFPVGIWGRPEDLPKEIPWEVPMEEVDQTVRWCFSEFNVVSLYADPPWLAEYLPKWARDFGEKRVTEFWTNVDTKMAVASGALRTAIRQQTVALGTDELRTHNDLRNGKPLFIWHLENARTRKVKIKLEDKAEEAYIVTKDRRGSLKKIDSAPAAILAYRARNDALKLGEFKKKKRGRLITF